jgi:hypothetical protein
LFKEQTRPLVATYVPWSKDTNMDTNNKKMWDSHRSATDKKISTYKKKQIPAKDD